MSGIQAFSECCGLCDVYIILFPCNLLPRGTIATSTKLPFLNLGNFFITGENANSFGLKPWFSYSCKDEIASDNS